MATLPEFPRSGHGTSAQLNTNRERYRAAADKLRAELARAEDTFTLALAEHDQRQQTRDRLAAMAKASRTTGRRN